MELKLNEKAFIKRFDNSVTRNLCIAAHPDDIEFMAFDGILRGDFSGVVVTDGAGSSRCGKYARVTDEEMIAIRKNEQIKSAELANFKFLAMINATSSDAKDRYYNFVDRDIAEIILSSSPTTVYMHNLFDKHSTHIGTALKTISAIRSIEKSKRPKKLYGCEVWRGLDWVDDDKKVIFDLSGGEKLARELFACFDSQIAGGKRYDNATIGRWTANATYCDSHSVDRFSLVSYALDLTPLIEDDDLSIRDFAMNIANGFILNLENNLKEIK